MKYSKPKAEVIIFDNSDVIITSGGEVCLENKNGRWKCSALIQQEHPKCPILIQKAECKPGSASFTDCKKGFPHYITSGAREYEI